LALNNQAESTQTAINQVMDHLGPLLAEALIYSIGGNSSRIQLDKYFDPLKKLVIKQKRAKSWLAAALASLQNDKISESDKSIFLQKVIK
jgi:hypothetical protein